MRLNEAIRKAIQEQNAAAAGRISDFLRARGLDYAGIYAMVERLTGTSEAEWEALVYECDWEAGS